MPKVYILNDLNHNFSKAERFGELVYVTQGKVPIFKTDALRNLLLKNLKDFNIDEDYLLISGPALLCVMAALLLKVDGKPIKTLVFDAKAQEYVVRHIYA